MAPGYEEGQNLRVGGVVGFDQNQGKNQHDHDVDEDDDVDGNDNDDDQSGSEWPTALEPTYHLTERAFSK